MVNKEMIDATSSRSQAGLQRAKAACLTCRQQKRKCDGRQPCQLCSKNHSLCQYAVAVRKSGAAHLTSTSAAVERESDQRSGTSNEPNVGINRTKPALVDLLAITSRQNAVSGMTFVETFGLNLDANDTPRIRSFAWNLGLRRAHESIEKGTLEQLLDWPSYQHLSSVYAREVGCVYSFVDMKVLDDRARQRFLTRSETHDPMLDANICLLCALGCLFSRASEALERSLYQNAKTIIDDICERIEPSDELVMACTLKTIYLRTVHSPYAAWVSSATALHYAEATGLHKLPLGMRSDLCDLASLFWIARLLNRWISFEYGKSHFELRLMTSPVNVSVLQVHSESLLRLFVLSDCLDPDQGVSCESLQQVLVELRDFGSSNHAVLLSRCVLALAVYRRLRLENIAISQTQSRTILAIGEEGLHTVEQILSENKSPWWHVSNLPFQFLCLALMLDTHESLSGLPRIMTIIESVHGVFGTDTTREAVEYSRKLIHVVASQKSRQAIQLQSMLPLHMQSKHEIEMRHPQESGCGQSNEQQHTTVLDIIEIGDEVFDDTLNEVNQYIEWDLFMNAAVPRLHPGSF
nr:transcription factor kojr [Quercus suber]